MSDQSINKFSAQNRFECNRTNLHGAFMILYNSRYIYTEYNGESVWLGALTSPAPARSQRPGWSRAVPEGGGRSINKFTGGSKLDLFLNKIKTVE